MDLSRQTRAAHRGQLELRWIAVLALSLALQGKAVARVDLSPASWPPGDLERYTQLHNSFGYDHATAVGDEGLVVGNLQALAVRSGVEALRQGGTAADAAVTTALTQIVFTAGSAVSFGGNLELMYYEAATGEVHYLNGTFDVPREETSPGTIPSCGSPSGRHVLVPGFMAALEALHERFGALPFKKVFEPAIYFAEEGFEANGGLGGTIHMFLDSITRLPGGRQIFLKADGTPYRTGDWFRQPRLARTLKKVSRKGTRYMYRGPWAHRLVNIVRSEGGHLSLADMRAHEAVWQEPTTFEFGGFSIHGAGDLGEGGTDLQRAMAGLQPGVLRQAGHYTDSVDAFTALLQGVERRYRVNRAQGHHSDGVVAVDAQGNVVAMLHSISTWGWGDTGIFVDGVSVSDCGCYMQDMMRSAGPGGRIVMNDNPVIVTRGGRPVAASSATGMGLFEVTFFSLVNLLAYDMNPKEAVETPTCHMASWDDSGFSHVVRQGDFSRQLLEAARSRGFSILDLSQGLNPGSWIGVTIDPGTGTRFGATVNPYNGLAMCQ